MHTNGIYKTEDEQTWAIEISEKIKEKMKKVAKRNQNKLPYTTVDGVYDDWTTKNVCWWCNGFWGGIMWQLYHATGEDIYRRNALDNEHTLDQNLMNHMGMDHDSGFKWLTTSGAHYRKTKNQEAMNRTLLAADNLAGRFNPVGQFIRAWNDMDGEKAGWAIIDCMMNLPILYWASEQTHDPRYQQIAQLHANTAMKYFVREDGSVNHIVEFNPYTGEFVKSYGGQGYGEQSSWTRGQAWAIYGFVLSYLHTKEDKYLSCAKRVANYFIANIPDSGCIPIDFRQPTEYVWEDSTAAAIAACGMLEIGEAVGGVDGAVYHKAAIRLLQTLADQRCNWSNECDNIIEKCSAAFHDKEHEFSIIYGDYFFIEAIWKVTGQELFIW